MFSPRGCAAEAAKHDKGGSKAISVSLHTLQHTQLALTPFGPSVCSVRVSLDEGDWTAAGVIMVTGTTWRVKGQTTQGRERSPLTSCGGCGGDSGDGTCSGAVDRMCVREGVGEGR
jgi:hypothetical protein